mmetsp:Transcript_15963/g.50029  ORF Transcript_15963/g.50029 Transcript_15963/m.50029 type:complete len:232 (-) Transcript_15963:31-726(-)
MQLNEHGLHERTARPLALSAQVAGHFFGGVVLFGAFEHFLRSRARRVHRAEVNSDLALRANGTAPGAGLWDIALAGAVGGAAHAIATSPLVSWQRSGSLLPERPVTLAAARNFVVVVARDAASFSSFFAAFTAAFAPCDDPYDSLRAAAAGGLAGFVCHAARFPLQTLYKRGRGWVATPDLAPSALARRFFSTSGRAVLSASLAFGAYEALTSALKQVADDDHQPSSKLPT